VGQDTPFIFLAFSLGAIHHRSMKQIKTPFGLRTLVRLVGTQGEYAETLPRPAAPNGEWWVFNLQHGWQPIASNGRALRAAIEAQT
jgi:hypothetical protein